MWRGPKLVRSLGGVSGWGLEELWWTRTGCRVSRACSKLRRVWDLAVGVGYQRREGPTGGAKKGLLGGTRVEPGEA